MVRHCAQSCSWCIIRTPVSAILDKGAFQDEIGLFLFYGGGFKTALFFHIYISKISPYMYVSQLCMSAELPLHYNFFFFFLLNK